MKEGFFLNVEVDSGNMMELQAHFSAIHSIRALKDGLLTCGDCTVNHYNFNMKSREDSESVPLELVHQNVIELGSQVTCCAANHEYIAVGLMDNTIRLLYNDTMQMYLTPHGHHLPVLQLNFYGKLLLSGSSDKSIPFGL